jgi:hypothetical protein
MAVFRRGGPPAARSEGRGSFRGSRRFDWTSCRGWGRPERRISTEARSGGGGVNDDGDAPAVNVGEGPARKHQ